MKIVKLFSHSISVIFLVVLVCCTIIVIMSVGKLPEIKTSYTEINPRESSEIKGSKFFGETLGKFGEMMVEMLPNDLAFTVFVPSEIAFERDLKIRVNRSFEPEQQENIYATVSRVLGFSLVPRKIYSGLVEVGVEVVFESISGFELRVLRESSGGLVVNGVRSERVDVEKGEVVVHVMDGVIMDAEFEQSV